MTLAVNTPTHLREIGLLPEKKSDYESKKEDIAYLFHVALQKVSTYRCLVENLAYLWFCKNFNSSNNFLGKSSKLDSDFLSKI